MTELTDVSGAFGYGDSILVGERNRPARLTSRHGTEPGPTPASGTVRAEPQHHT